MTTFLAAAFGDQPDRLVTTVPPDPHERWLAAVVLGAQGWYARARTLLTELADHPDPVLAALAAATLASHRRQLGAHTPAQADDAHGLARLTDPTLASHRPQPDAHTPAQADDAHSSAHLSDPTVASRSRQPGIDAPARAGDAQGSAHLSDPPVASRRGQPGADVPARADDAPTLASHRRPSEAHAAARAEDVRGLAGLTESTGGPHPGELAGRVGPDRAGAGGEGAVGWVDAGGVGLAGAGAAGDRAAGSDSAAVVLAGVAAARERCGGEGDLRLAAWSDVLLGLAADAVGVGRLGLARRLLAAAPGDAGWRAAVRAGWVAAEIELAAGRPALAVRHAELAADHAAAAGSVRHRIKSALVLGASLGAVGRPERAVPIVSAAHDDAADLGLLTLSWPAAIILAELEPTRADQFRRCAALALRSVLRRTDPVGRRLAESSPWVPRPAGPTG